MTSSHRLPPPPALERDWALFLDVDGCLIDFADRPEAVAMPSGLLDTLDRLHRLLDGALALVSGRPLAQIDALFAPLHLPAVGLHGLEHRDHQADPDPPAADLPLLARIRHAARAIAEPFPGAWIEDKGTTLALHWRSAPDAEPALTRFARDAIADLPGYRLQPGNQVLELRPDGHDKGSAIAHLMATSPFAGRRPVFAGDDLTDEYGFATVNAQGGVSILIGERQPSAAVAMLASPAALRQWLHQSMSRLSSEATA